MTKKITKRDILSITLSLIETAEEQGFGLPEGFTYEVLKNFIEKELSNMDSRNAAAAQKKLEAADELRDKIASVLTDQPQTIPEIIALIDDPEISIPKAVPRLVKLCKLGLASKENITVTTEDSDKVLTRVAYRKA